jgi:hypothetical protein
MLGYLPLEQPGSSEQGDQREVCAFHVRHCSEHEPICHLFELILVIHANTSNGTNHIV